MLVIEMEPSGKVDLDLILGRNDALEFVTFFAWLRIRLDLPNYCSTNLDSLEECLNDLSWLPSKAINIRLRIEFYDAFLKDEPDWLRLNVLDIFDRIHLPTSGDEPNRVFQISIAPCERATTDINKIRIENQGGEKISEF